MGLHPKPVEQLGLSGPDPYDARDRLKSVRGGNLKPINLTQHFPITIRDQGRTNRCGGFAGVVGLEILSRRLTGEYTQWSANELYWFARPANIRAREDSGVYMRDLMKAMTVGVIPLAMWKDHQSPLTRPTQSVTSDSRIRFKTIGYERVQGSEAVRATLSEEYLPVWIGASLYERSVDNSTRTGHLLIPQDNDTYIGGHAMVIVGWFYKRDNSVWFIVANSWGPHSGQAGFFMMPAAYIDLGYCNDMWSVPKKYA